MLQNMINTAPTESQTLVCGVQIQRVTYFASVTK